MKKTQKIAAILLALVMAFAMTVTAFAADEQKTITVPETDPHSYEVYQIFTGVVTDNTLSSVKWGKNGTGTQGTFVDSAIVAELGEYVDSTDNNDKLEVITKYVKLSSTPYGTIASGKALNVPTGYYLLKDTNSLGSDDVETTYIVTIVEDVTVVRKGSVPTAEKKVIDTNDSTGETSTWQDSADHDIGDAVPFKLTGTLPDNLVDFSTYKYVFHDTLSTGLTFNDDVKVTLDTEDGTDITDNFTVTFTNGSLTIACDDLKVVEGLTKDSKIVVTYTGTLNEDAVLGSSGNPNTVYLEYSNKPDQGGEGTPDSTGRTPDDTVIVFTYKTVISKVDEDSKPLSGAEFTLEKYVDDAWVAVDVVKNAEGTVFTFTGIDDGNYRITETVAPAGCNPIEPIYFTVSAEHDILSDDPALTVLEAIEKDATFEANKENGLVIVGDVSDCTLSTDIVNKTGSILPSTGGIGTTIFYVVGAILVMGAVILLVTKKRMGAAK